MSIIFLAACSLILSILFTPVVRELARRQGWVDHPDHGRKIHAAAVPRIGGLSIVLAYASSLGILMLARPGDIPSLSPTIKGLWPAAAVIFAMGLLDDLIGLKPRPKLAVEIVGAILAWWGGIRIETLAGFHLGNILGFSLTILWLVWCTNAFNLIDGVDGLAGGLGLLASITILSASLLNGHLMLAVFMAPLGGALLGFLFFNFNPASIFLGDSGSLWIGFILACFGVTWSQQSTTALGSLAPVMALAIPILDTGLSILRRFLRREPVFRGDRGHIHHRLLDHGFTSVRVVLLLYAGAGAAALLSVLDAGARDQYAVFIAALFCILVWAAIRYLRYPEFHIAMRLISGSSFRSTVRFHFRLRCHEQALQAAANSVECWRSLKSVARDFGFRYLEVRLAGHHFEEQLDSSPQRGWTLHVPLPGADYVRFTCPLDESSAPANLAPLIEVLHRTLSERAAQFESQPAIAKKRAASAMSRSGSNPVYSSHKSA